MVVVREKTMVRKVVVDRVKMVLMEEIVVREESEMKKTVVEVRG